MNFFASCPRGIEEVLLKEANHLNFEYVDVTRGGINFKSSPLKAITFLFETRVASRVFKEIGSFHFTSDKDLYKSAREIPWTKILNPNDSLKIETILSREIKRNFKNSHFISLLLKDAIVDEFKDKAGKRPSIDLEDPLYPLTLRIEPHPSKKGYRGIVVLDLMGTPLFKRGYRVKGHEAPIKENLASGLLLLTDWDRKSCLVDPFCGSGTFLIEGTFLRHQISPLILLIKKRIEEKGTFLFENQKWFQKDKEIKTPLMNLFKEHFAHYQNAIQNFQVGEVVANDIDKRSLNYLVESWTILNFPRKALRIENVNATMFNSKKENKALIITNPPYGIRLEAPDKNLLKLYHDFGENLRTKWKGDVAYIVSQDPAFRKAIPLRTSQRTHFFNGPLECSLLRYDLS